MDKILLNPKDNYLIFLERIITINSIIRELINRGFKENQFGTICANKHHSDKDIIGFGDKSKQILFHTKSGVCGYDNNNKDAVILIDGNNYLSKDKDGTLSESGYFIQDIIQAIGRARLKPKEFNVYMREFQYN